MIPRVRFGKTGAVVTRLALGGYPFGGVNRARGWDPFTKEGRRQAIGTVCAALDAGITLIDTAPGYGEGNSESIIGEALDAHLYHQGRREEVFLATKVGYHGTVADMDASVEASLRRLRTEHVDLLQFHGGMYTDEQVRHIVEDGLLAKLVALKDAGRTRFIGFTVEEPWTAKPLIATGVFDVIQVRYNLIYQAAALHVLDEAQAVDMGISVMRPMTSGILQRLASEISPQLQDAVDLYELALKFVLSDSRVHVANVGMRWSEEVEKNVALVSTFAPAFDVADLPRMTAHIYQAEDQTTAEL